VEIAGIRELMAVATVRRVLLELGYEMLPEPTGTLVGPLALWIHQPREEWDSLTPLQVLALPDGEGRLRTCLEALVKGSSSWLTPLDKTPP
jgi:hypothetical protein